MSSTMRNNILIMACLYAVVAALNIMAPPATSKFARIRDAMVKYSYYIYSSIHTYGVMYTVTMFLKVKTFVLLQSTNRKTAF